VLRNTNSVMEGKGGERWGKVGHVGRHYVTRNEQTCV